MYDFSIQMFTGTDNNQYSTAKSAFGLTTLVDQEYLYPQPCVATVDDGGVKYHVIPESLIRLLLEQVISHRYTRKVAICLFKIWIITIKCMVIKYKLEYRK